MDLLRFSTAGSVDDGKSTLIGRLLFDTKTIFEDQLAAVRRATRNPGTGGVDLSLLTDGLKAEREQGITIDVAYRYFATPRRKFIIADTPGHEQYTRNMATGASTADLAVILVDARAGVLVQSKRHTAIAHLLGIPHLVVAVNKMDLMGYEQATFAAIRTEFEAFAARLGARKVVFIPVSALVGDNVVHRSAAMPWYTGPSLLEHLETVEVTHGAAGQPFRLPVQMVLRPHQNFRGFAGTVASGSVQVGDAIIALPSGRRSRVRAIHTHGGELPEAAVSQAVTLLLDDEIDVSRGDLLAAAAAPPSVTHEFEADLVWMSDTALDPGRPYLIRHTTQAARGRVVEVRYRIDVNTLDRVPAKRLALNEIGRVRLATAQPLCADLYAVNHTTGAFVLVDLETNHTVAAGMIRELRTPAGRRDTRVDRAAREAGQGHRAGVVWLAGPAGAGKGELARLLEARLFGQGVNGYVVDSERLAGDGDLGRRAALAARLLVDAGLVAIFTLPGLSTDDRERVRQSVGAEHFVEIQVDTPAALCAPHGTGQLASAAAAPPADAAYAPPAAPDLVLPLPRLALDAAVDQVLAVLAHRGLRKTSAYLGGAGI